jgi:hypothetical protein
MHVHASLYSLLSLALPFPSLRSETQGPRTRSNEHSLWGRQIRTIERRDSPGSKAGAFALPEQLGKQSFPVFHTQSNLFQLPSNRFLSMHIQSNPFQLPSNQIPSSTSNQNPFQRAQLTSASAPSWAARSSSPQSSSSGRPPPASCSPSRSPPPQTRTDPPPRPS